MQREIDEKAAQRILGHPARRRIVELLGELGPLSWKDLSAKVGISTGVLYYHIDTLEVLVSRDQAKRYALTPAGKRVADHLRANPTPSGTSVASVIAARSRLGSLASLFLPRGLMTSLGSSTGVALAATLAVSATLMLGLAYFGYVQVLYFLFPASTYGVEVAAFAGSFVALLLAGLGASLIIYRAKPSFPPLAAGCVVSFIPVEVLGFLAKLLPKVFASQLVLTPLLVFAQAWSATLLASALSVSSGVRVEKTVLVSLALLYATTAVALAFGGLF